MTGGAIVTEVISILTSGLTSMATALGSGIKDIVTSVFFTTSGDTTSLSIIAILMLVFGGISLAFSLFRYGLQFVTSWGNKN